MFAPVPRRESLRYEMRRDVSELFLPLAGEVALSGFLLWGIIDGWTILVLLPIGIGLLLFWIVANLLFRLQNYVTLHEERVDVKQVPWWGDELKTFRIPYESIMEVRTDDERVSLELGEATSSGVKTVSFRPIDSSKVASQIRNRVEAVKDR